MDKGTRERRPIPADFASRLATGAKVEDIATALRVDRRTIWNWTQRPDVIAEVTRIQRASSSAVLTRMKAAQATATDAVLLVLTGGKCEECGRGAAKDADQLRAAEILYDRTGMPRQTQIELSGSVDMADPAAMADEALEADVIEEAAVIAQSRGRGDLAAALRAMVTVVDAVAVVVQ